jgi:integrase
MLDAGLTPRSIQYCFATFRQCWNASKNAGLANSEAPSKKVNIPKRDNRRMRFLTHEEADTLLTELSARSQQLHDMALLALHCGLRAGEIFNLAWGDVDLGRGLLSLRDTKSGKSRMGYMTGEVKTMFEQMGSGGQNELVFKVIRKALRKKGEMRVKQVSNSFDRAITDLGLNAGVTDRRQRVVFHTLRHTFASWHVEAGTDLYTVKELMGHGTLAMTERYSHLSENTCRAAVRNMEKAVSGRKPKVVALEKK